MLKPWLLMNQDEKEVRRKLYLDLISSTSPIDEGLLISLKPPESKLEALFELFIFQTRFGRKKRC